MLVVNPKKRLSAAEAIKHPWFNIVKDMEEDQKLSKEVLDRFKNFRGVSQFKKAAMNVLVKTINQDEV